MRKLFYCAIAALCAWGVSFGQDPVEEPTVTAPIERPPSFQAGLAIGFNYDFIKSPTEVSFDYPQAYLGINIPFRYDASTVMQQAFTDIESDTTIFKAGTRLQPQVSARQNANATVRVDVPMMGGVASFSNTQNFHLSYFNVLGNPTLYFDSKSLGDQVADMSFLMRGTVNVPVELSFGWETMTFGYAYRINKGIIFALNLHRHIFDFDVSGNANVDIFGKYSITPDMGETGFGGAITVNGDIDYPSSNVNGFARGHYSAEVWSPTLGVRLWRIGLTSRFGIDTYANGSLNARYSLPFFIDPETFQVSYDLEDPATLASAEFQDNLEINAVDGIEFRTREKEDKLHWKMPQGHTIDMYIIPDKLKISYTKFFGEMSMSLNGISKVQVQQADTLESREVGFDVGVKIDHVLMLSGKFHYAFFNLGVFAFDFRSGDKEHLLGTALKNASIPTFGESAMVPVLRFGSAFGTRLQLALELEVLPLPAVKTGLYYNF